MTGARPQFMTVQQFTHTRRHPALVTYDRLVEASQRYADKLDGHERDAIGEVCQALWEIAEGQR